MIHNIQLNGLASRGLMLEGVMGVDYSINIDRRGITIVYISSPTVNAVVASIKEAIANHQANIQYIVVDSMAYSQEALKRFESKEQERITHRELNREITYPSGARNIHEAKLPAYTKLNKRGKRRWH